MFRVITHDTCLYAGRGQRLWQRQLPVRRPCATSTLANSRQSHIQNAMRLRDEALKVHFYRPQSKQSPLLHGVPTGSFRTLMSAFWIGILEKKKKNASLLFPGYRIEVVPLFTETQGGRGGGDDYLVINNTRTTHTPKQKQPFSLKEIWSSTGFLSARPSGPFGIINSAPAAGSIKPCTESAFFTWFPEVGTPSN